MRGVGCAALLLLASSGASTAALAGPAAIAVSVSRESYPIRGKTGDQLLEAMDRRGPKHGLLTRAIAQTRYSVGWDITWAANGGVCRVETANAKLLITYTYPEVAGGVPPALKSRWATFMRGVVHHEENHGKMARDMVADAERAVSKIAIRNDPGCAKARAETKRRADAIYARYEQRQVQFDVREHSAGGNVDRLIARLRG